MSSFSYHQFLYGSDNYGVLVHDPVSGQTAAIDAGDGAAYKAALAETGWTLSHVLITHHHGDHTEGLAELAAEADLEILGPRGDKPGHVGITSTLSDGDSFTFAGCEVRVMETPGHTLDMLNFYLPSEGVCFTGDTLFALGCGRVFEGDFPMMWNSLSKLIAALPSDTVIYCSHEYTEANAAFAVTVDPENYALKARAETITKLRSNCQPTIPTTMAEELATNPFLRASDPAIRKFLSLEGADDVAVFAEIRTRKDNF
tara:strand:- start:2180 stop:2953 length:774 start_codon:yes stop_codon:yes gene_type:complete